MKLGQGITTVVGPNGCGKTNIVDAIRWVLGEQKYSILRSGKMEDVIFNGSDGAKPLGVCEVSMTVHNNAGKLPIEYNDIEIARRVYRSGESEYYLNKTQCRLKDIMNLFIDTGMGADAYSVIELKMIEQILSETADERRKMFEEAAGIHKYRSQKKSTIRKFEATRIDLERIKDIISEVEQKVHNLELQLKRFKRHATLTQTLEIKDKELAFLQIHRHQTLILPLRKKIDEYRNLRESKTSESSVHEQELAQLRETYKSQETELNEFQLVAEKMIEKRETLRNSILVSTEKRRGALLTIDRLDREKSSNFSKIEHFKQLKLDFDKEITDLEPTIEDQLNIYKSEKKKFVLIDKKYQQSVDDLDNMQNERWELQRKVAEDSSLYDRTKSLISDRISEIKEFDDIMKHQKDKNTKDTKKHKNLEKEKKLLTQELLKSKKLYGSIEVKISNLNNEKALISEEQYDVAAMKKSLIGQREFYNELVESREGFPEGTRFVLENPKLYPEILGTVADMFQVDDTFRDALESGLGDLSHCLIAKDRLSALKTLEISKNENAGDLTVIPLREASELTSDLNPLPSSEHIIARASDLVKTSEELKPLADYLLGNLLVVESLNIVADSKDFLGWNLVDISGAFSGNNLILKNRQSSEHGHIIGRQKKLGLISSEIDSLNTKEKELKERSKSLLKLISSSESQLSSQSKIIKELSDNFSQIEMDVVRGQMMLNQHKEKLDESILSKKKAEKELKELQQAMVSLEPDIKKANDKLESFQKKVEHANDSMLVARKVRDEFQNTLQEKRIKLIELESRRDQLKFKKKSGEETSSELKIRQEKIKQEIIELESKNKKLVLDKETNEKELESLNAEIQKQRSIIDLKQVVYKETFQSIEELQARISSEQRNREQILEELKNYEIEVTEADQKIQLVEERIRERYNSRLSKNLVVDLSEEQLELEIEKIQRSIENIGPVNMAVQNEHSEEVERLDMLLIQRDDLLEAEENLRKTIRKIDKIARKRFKETFDLIKMNFENLFKMFFEGGNASLRLLGDPDPLEADISIEAQPPGKRNTSLRLLSSGEKALTAISLLFSIYQVKPSPYCILDEVDAPLDDVNIHKFTRVLGKFCDETQFIIVTHNKLTMEIADYMYGVTQEKKGISKLVSVKFD